MKSINLNQILYLTYPWSKPFNALRRPAVEEQRLIGSRKTRIFIKSLFLFIHWWNFLFIARFENYSNSYTCCFRVFKYYRRIICVMQYCFATYLNTTRAFFVEVNRFAPSYRWSRSGYWFRFYKRICLNNLNIMSQLARHTVLRLF